MSLLWGGLDVTSEENLEQKLIGASITLVFLGYVVLGIVLTALVSLLQCLFCDGAKI